MSGPKLYLTASLEGTVFIIISYYCYDNNIV